MNKKFSLAIGATVLAALVTGGAVRAFAQNGKAPQASAVPVASSAASAAPAPAQASQKELLFRMNGFGDADRRDLASIQSQDLRARNGSAAYTKAQIYDKMLNTADFYQSLQGTYSRHSAQEDYRVSYQILNGSARRSLEKLQYTDGSTALFSYFDGTTITRNTPGASDKAKSGEKALSVTPANKDAAALAFVPMVKSTSRIKQDATGERTYYYREDLHFLHYARESLTPQEMAFGYLADFSKWTIAGQEQVAGRSCMKLQGTLSGDYAQKLNTHSFALWVDAQTGVLLKYINYNAAGKAVEQLETSSFTVNGPVSAASIQRAAAALQ